MATAAAKVVESVEPPPVVDAPGEDEFSKMFKEFSVAEMQPTPKIAPVAADPPPKVLGVETPEPGKTLEEPVSEIEGAPEPGKPAPDGGKEPTAKGDIQIAPPDAKDTPQGTDDKIERLIEALTQRAAPASTTEPATRQPAAPPLYNADEITALTEFAKEWPDVARAQEILLRGTAQAVSQRIYAEIAAVIGPKLALLDTIASNMQYDDVQRRVPGYEAVIPKLATWAEGQKIGYLKSAYLGVIEGGTPEEIADLVSRYRAETGDQTGVVTQPQTETKIPPKTPEPSLSSAANKAAARLAPVVGKVTAPEPGAPQTYEDGFVHALKLLG